jgi:hypothetical protein
MKKIEMNETCSMHGEMSSSYRTSVKTHKGKSLSECLGCILEIDIKIDLEGIRCVGVDWIQLVE